MFGLDRLQGQTVLITGASAGIGAATAKLFASLGSNVILAARRLERVESLAKELSQAHPQVTAHPVQLDVTDRKAVAALVESLPEPLRDIDVLVNNAGAALDVNKSWEVEDADVDVMLDANVKGIVWMQRALVPRMLERGRGHVINVSSISGTDTYPGGGVYAATKHAVHALTHTLRQELVATGVNVSMVSPGLVNTEFSTVRFKGDQGKADSVYKGMVPLTGEDVAESIVFAASRPPHVQYGDLLVLPSCQARHLTIHRDSSAK